MAELLERNGNKVKFKVIVPADEVNAAFTGVFNALTRQVRVPGFRPGKAPKKVLEQRLGTDYVKTEVRDRLVNLAYPKAVRELELIPVSATIDHGDIAEHTPFEFTVDAENYPEVKLPTWEGFTLEAKKLEIEDKDVEEALEQLQQRQASYDPVERAAEANDLATVEILDGEDAGQSYPVYLERAEEGVRTALTGKAAGDEVEVPVSGGEEQEAQTLRVRVVDIKAKSVPELDDEFAKTLEVDTLEELRTKVREDLIARADVKFVSDRKDEFVTKLAEGMTTEVPEVLVDRRREALEKDLENDLGRQGIGLEGYREYLKLEGKLEEFESDLTKSATERVRRDLALEKLTEEMKVELTDDEWRNALENYARSNRVSVPRLRELIGEEGIGNLKVIVARDKALDAAISKLA